ncbi:MAG: hypothetical protein SNJ71_07955, partial [Bacteroidales bacterium]
PAWVAVYLENNQIQCKSNYVTGRKHGKHIYYYKSGKKERIENYRYGKKVGKWLYYNYSGELYLIVHYKNDKEKKSVYVK